MKDHYKNFTPGLKRSIIFSMRQMVKEFMSSYNNNVEFFETQETLTNDLYFYWLRYSAEKQYAWCKELDDTVFSTSFTEEMKLLLKTEYLSFLIKKTKNENVSKNKIIV